jgi:hypothetical protein
MFKQGKRPVTTLPGLTPGERKHAATLVEELEDDLDEARQQGIFGLLRLRWEAWMDERLRGAVERKMSARQGLIKAKTQTAKTEQELSETVHDGTKQGVRHEIETTQLEHLRVQSQEVYNPQIASRIIPQLVSVGTPPPASGEVIEAVPVVRAGTLGSPMTVHISDEEIDQESYQILMKVGSGELSEVDLPAYQKELTKRYQPLVAAEILSRAQGLIANSLPAGTSSPSAGVSLRSAETVQDEGVLEGEIEGEPDNATENAQPPSEK